MTENTAQTTSTEPASILITGATGFVGTAIVRALGRGTGAEPAGPFANTRVAALVRDPGKNIPGVEIVTGDVTVPSSLAGKLDGIETVIHLVAIIEEEQGRTFDSVIRAGTEHVAAEAKRAGVRHFIHMSALGAQDTPAFPYHQAKHRSERAVKASGVPYTIFRPSIIFGQGDGFISVLAGVVKSFPVIPVVGSGDARFSPIAVEEVAQCFVAVLANPAAFASATCELGGGKTYTYQELLGVIARQLGTRNPYIHLPVRLMKTVVAASRPLPKALRPPVTGEQLKMLALDNSVDPAVTTSLLGHKPLALEDGVAYITTA